MKKLAIVGTHDGTRHLAPWDDHGYDIWVFNETPQASWCKRWDACFQMHKPDVYRSANNHVRADHWEWLKELHGRPIYMQDYDSQVPDCLIYPLEDVIRVVPGAQLRWFDSTAAYALALGLYFGYREIECYGLDMHSDTEYGYQLRNWQFWVGVGMGMGARFDRVSNEAYFGGPMYGYEGEIQMERAYFAARVIEGEVLFKQADHALYKLRDRVNAALLERRHEKMRELMPVWEQAALSAGEASGLTAAAEKYAGREDIIPRQEFERGMAQAQKEGEALRAQMWHTGGKAEYVWNVWKQSDNPEAARQLRALAQQQIGLAFEVGVRSGLYREHLKYLNELDRRIRAAGGQRSVRALASEEVYG